ncbi:MAG: ABC transporter permease subunit [Desulfurococcaceae archaeon]
MLVKFSPVLYDFKRGLLRRSVILVLVLFTVSGVGLAYLVSSTLGATPLVEGKYVILITVDTGTKTLSSEGRVYDMALRDMSGTLSFDIYCYNATEPVEAAKGQILRETIVFRGEFKEKKRVESIPHELPVGYQCVCRFSLSTPYGYISNVAPTFIGRIENRTLIFAVISDQYMPYAIHKITETGLETEPEPGREPYSHGILLINAIYREGVNITVVGSVLVPAEPELKLDLYMREQGSSGPASQVLPVDIEGAGYRKIATLDQGVFAAGSSLRNRNVTFVDLLVIGETGKGVKYYAVVSAHPTEIVGVNQRSIAVINVLLGGAGLSLFNGFFPIVMLYLVYIYIAKPRSQGALEFVVARPITRFDLYVTRFVAGVLVAVVASTIFYTVLITTLWLLLEVFIEPYVNLLMYSGIVLSLVAFYSLCYFVSTITRGAGYLAFAIFLFILFTIILSVIASVLVVLTSKDMYGPEVYKEMMKLQYLTRYFTPFGVQDFIEFYVTRYYNINLYGDALRVIESVVQPWAVALSVTLWILLPVVAGWYTFKKANLSS